MPTTDRVCSALGWDLIPDPSAGITFSGRTARRIRIGAAGDLYLIPVGGSNSNQAIYAEDCVAGEQFDVQFDGIGSSTTCTNLTVSY